MKWCILISISQPLSSVKITVTTKTMSAVNSKLLIIKSDFALFKQNKSDMQGALKAVHISEVDKNHNIKKTTILYPSQNSTQSTLKKIN